MLRNKKVETRTCMYSMLNMNKYVAYSKGQYVYIDLANAGKKKNFSDYEEL